MAFFHSPLPSRSEWTTMAAIAVSLFEFLVHCDINWKFEKEYSFFFLFWNWTSIDQPRSYERRWSTHFNFDESPSPSREYSVKNQSFRRIDTTSSNMANTKEKAWRERERERVDASQIGTAARNCYKSCSRRFAAIEFRTVREFHPLQGVNISQNYL